MSERGMYDSTRAVASAKSRSSAPLRCAQSRIRMTSSGACARIRLTSSGAYATQVRFLAARARLSSLAR